MLVSQSHLTMVVVYTRQPITSHHVGLYSSADHISPWWWLYSPANHISPCWFILVSQSHLTMLVAYTRQPITSHHVGVGPDEAGIVHGHQVVDADVDHARPAVLVPQSRRRTGLHHGYSRPRHRGHLEGQPQKTQKTHTHPRPNPQYTPSLIFTAGPVY